MTKESSLESYLQELHPQAAYLVVSGTLQTDRKKITRIIEQRGLTVLEERVFPATSPQDEGALDLVIRLPPCSLQDLILDLSGAGVAGSFKGYGGKR